MLPDVLYRDYFCCLWCSWVYTYYLIWQIFIPDCYYIRL